MQNSKPTGLRAKMGRVFALQVLMISLATLLGIYVSNSIVQDVLMRSALNGEAEHYWNLYRSNPNQPLPNTDNLMGYMTKLDASGTGGRGDVPVAVYQIGHEPGYHRGSFDGDAHIVHVSDFQGSRLYLVFDSDSVSDLALFFGIVPLAIVLLLGYALLFFAYRMSQQAISPIVQLARIVDEFEFSNEHAELELGVLREQADTEVSVMLDALDHFTERVNAFVERERLFTRDASHELRTPVAVFKASLDLLAKSEDRSPAEEKALQRMRRTVNDMEGLIETLLLLANEQIPPMQDVLVNEIARGQAEQLQPLAEKAGTELKVVEDSELHVEGPVRVIQILLTNLLKNAITYTKAGTVELRIDATYVVVADTGVGMAAEELQQAFDPFYRSPHARANAKGHGLGLSIVKRMVDRFGWEIEATSEVGAGTQVKVLFKS